MRTLTWYDKRSDEWLGEARLRAVRTPLLRKVFGAPVRDPMYDAYRVEQRHVPALRKWTDVQINLEKYDYFVECSAAGVLANAVLSSR